MRKLRKTKTQEQLEAAGFVVHRAYPTQGRGRSGNQWFAVTDPNGEEAAVLRQSIACWHWFSKHHRWTASGSSVATCHKGGLGDAIATDSQMKTYESLLDEYRVPVALHEYEGVWAAMQQVYAERQ